MRTNVLLANRQEVLQRSCKSISNAAHTSYASGWQLFYVIYPDWMPASLVLPDYIFIAIQKFTNTK